MRQTNRLLFDYNDVMQNIILKSTALTFALVSVLACSGSDQNNPVLSIEDKDEIRLAVKESFSGLVQAAQSLDVDAYFEYFDKEHFTALNADGTVVHSLAEFQGTARQQFAALESYRSLEFDKVKISVINHSTAILVNEYQADVVLSSGELVSTSGGGTQVWTLKGGTWKLVSVSSSVGN